MAETDAEQSRARLPLLLRPFLREIQQVEPERDDHGANKKRIRHLRVKNRRGVHGVFPLREVEENDGQERREVAQSRRAALREELRAQRVVVVHGHHADEGDDRETDAVVRVRTRGNQRLFGQSAHERVENAGDGVGDGLEATGRAVDVRHLVGEVVVEDVDEACG